MVLVNALDVDPTGFLHHTPKMAAERGLLFVVLSLIYMDKCEMKDSKHSPGFGDEMQWAGC